MTMELVAYLIMGTAVYLLAYMVVGIPAVLIWRHWAASEFGCFWDVSLGEAMEIYYPRIWNLMESKVARVGFVLAWPVALPVMMAIMSKSLKSDRDFNELMYKITTNR